MQAGKENGRQPGGRFALVGKGGSQKINPLFTLP
jgi:hypothetical protein